ncbi:unnamed protein product [Paramecium sonneborni]|uniref:Uncharacterized protein n=1 Tax=Paramecium sonneborni TaxID=65129 RepID=A0A8S1R930_9CILI|nr:unnamed protein product [Paramecium sonneborni]
MKFNQLNKQLKNQIIFFCNISKGNDGSFVFKNSIQSKIQYQKIDGWIQQYTLNIFTSLDFQDITHVIQKQVQLDSLFRESLSKDEQKNEITFQIGYNIDSLKLIIKKYCQLYNDNMLNQTMTLKLNSDQIQEQTNKIRSMNSILQFNDQNQILVLLNIDMNWLKIQSFCCKTRGQFQDKLYTDLTIRNLSIKHNIQNWYKKKNNTPIIKLPSQHTQQYQLNQRFQEQKSVVLPSLKPLSFAYTQIQKKYKQIKGSTRKKTPVQQSAVQCPINTVEFKKPDNNKTVTTRLHSNRFKTVIEIKILQDNKYYMLSDQAKDINVNYPQSKGKDEVETMYSQFFGSINRKRAITISNGLTNQIDLDYKSTNLEDKIKFHKF